MSLILYGPPGTGKTTLALIVSSATNRRFVQLSALNAGVKDVRAVIDEAKREPRPSRPADRAVHRRDPPLLQDPAGLAAGAVEARHVTLVAATTENPFFSIVSPLLSRSLLLTLSRSTTTTIGSLVDRALVDERGLGGAVDARRRRPGPPVRLAGGDARRALTALEAAAGTALADGPRQRRSTSPTLEQAVDTAAVRYDRDGDQHYDVISAFIKSIRGSDVDAALHYLARMIEAGEDPRFIARRLVVHASEDIGLADPTALLAAVAAAQAVALIGLPEARINLAQATIHLALAPKSNAVIAAIDAALADVRAGLAGGVPPHCATRTTPARRSSATASATATRTTGPKGWSPSSTRPTNWSAATTTSPAGHGAERRTDRAGCAQRPRRSCRARRMRSPEGASRRSTG